MGHATWSQLSAERRSAASITGATFVGINIKSTGHILYRCGRLRTRVRCNPSRDGDNEIGIQATGDVVQELSDRLDSFEGQLKDMTVDDLEDLNNVLEASQERVQQALQQARKMRLLTGDDRSGGLALKLLQSFLQARIDGLGKESKFAVEDLIELTVDAARASKTIKQIKEDVSLAEYLMAERGKLTRELEKKRDTELELLCTWIDVIFLTLEALKLAIGSIGDETLDKTEFSNEEANSALRMYVEGVVSMYKNYGYDARKQALEELYAGPPQTQSVEVMRNTIKIVLLTIERVLDHPKTESSDS